MSNRIKHGGRKKGTPNRLTADIKQMILDALDEAGGVDYLVKQSFSNPTAFLTLVGKVLPLTLAGDPDNPFLLKDISDKPIDSKQWLEQQAIEGEVIGKTVN